jgi:translation initiation factor IF-2
MTKDTTKTENLVSRPPVVVILGHVDHGKSSILQAIKDLKITEKESGGITQHIGAYEIEEKGKKITFIDTPGHEAFSAMRARGAKVADIAVLVVAADEGVKPQTKEAIEHIKKAGIPMIVALNKIDKPTANPEKVKRELLAYDISVESLGGKIPSVEISAKTKKGIDNLLEMILLIAEIENLKADISKPAKGVIIESYMDPLRGPIATLILEQGILKKGENIGTSSAFGKVKGLENFLGEQLNEAFPALPAVILGFENVPIVGEEFKVYPDMEAYKKEREEKKQSKRPEVIAINPEQKIMNIILKTDVSGSLEAIEEILKNLPQEKTVLRILKKEVGVIDDSDIKLAKSANAKIIGFRVKTNPSAQKLALKDKISIISFDIIYELAQAVRNLLEKTLEPEITRKNLGKIKILAVFKIDKSRQIIGGKVIDGIVKRGALAEIIRDKDSGQIIGKGKIVSLQQDKKDVEEVGKRTECGIMYEGQEKIKEGDILNLYLEEKIKRTL